MTEAKNSLDALKSRMEMTGKGVSEFEDNSIEVIQSEKQRETFKNKKDGDGRITIFMSLESRKDRRKE